MRAYLRGADRDQPAFACRWLRVESAAQLRADFCPGVAQMPWKRAQRGHAATGAASATSIARPADSSTSSATHKATCADAEGRPVRVGARPHHSGSATEPSTGSRTGGRRSPRCARRHYYFDPSFAQSIVDLARREGFRRVLDVGAGVGKYVRFYRERGLEAFGIDGRNRVYYHYSMRVCVARCVCGISTTTVPPSS